MIKKLERHIREEDGVKISCPPDNVHIIHKINELVDAVNELQKNATISKTEKVETEDKDLSDKIGKLETELDRTKKQMVTKCNQLEIAVDALKSVKRYLCEMPAPDGATVLRMACESATTVKKALGQIKEQQ